MLGSGETESSKRVEIMETNIAIVIGVVVGLALLAVTMLFLRKRSADKLRLRFGPEYERAVEEAGGRQKAIAQLHQREKRVRRLAIKPLTDAEREHYVPAWKDIQAQFIDDPKVAVLGADQLLGEVMAHRGYPVGDFEQRSADLSVDYPIAVQNYRTAHDIAVRDAHGEASTEDLRQALLCQRALFRELTGQSEVVEPVIDDAAVPVVAEALVDESVPSDESTAAELAPSERAVVVDATPAADESAPVPAPVINREPVNAPATVNS